MPRQDNVPGSQAEDGWKVGVAWNRSRPESPEGPTLPAACSQRSGLRSWETVRTPCQLPSWCCGSPMRQAHPPPPLPSLFLSCTPTAHSGPASCVCWGSFCLTEPLQRLLREEPCPTLFAHLPPRGTVGWLKGWQRPPRLPSVQFPMFPICPLLPGDPLPWSETGMEGCTWGRLSVWAPSVAARGRRLHRDWQPICHAGRHLCSWSRYIPRSDSTISLHRRLPRMPR